MASRECARGEAFVAAMMQGGLPKGGVVHATPVWALHSPPKFPASAHAVGLEPRRTDIPLAGQLAFRVDDVLTPDECDTLVSISESLGYRDAAPGISTPPGMRMNKALHWVADDGLLGAIFARIGHLLPPVLEGDKLASTQPLSHRLDMYKYDAEDVFNMHTDGSWPGYGLDEERATMVEWDDCHSKLSMLLYLNGPEDGVEGGHTNVYSRDGQVVKVVPKKGSALLFRHGHGRGSVLHEGAKVTSEAPKYVARINVMYDL